MGKIKELTFEIASLAGIENRRRDKQNLTRERYGVKARIEGLTDASAINYGFFQEELHKQKLARERGVANAREVLEDSLGRKDLPTASIKQEEDGRIHIFLSKEWAGSIPTFEDDFLSWKQGQLEFRLVKEEEFSDSVNAERRVSINGFDLLKSKDDGQFKYIEKRTGVSGDDVESAKAIKGSPLSDWEVSVKFTSAGRKKFADLTKANVYRDLAIVLNGELLMAPVIRDAITGGSASISGNYTEEDAKQVAFAITSGNLGINFEIGSKSLIKNFEEGSNADILALLVIFANLVLLIVFQTQWKND